MVSKLIIYTDRLHSYVYANLCGLYGHIRLDYLGIQFQRKGSFVNGHPFDICEIPDHRENWDS